MTRFAVFLIVFLVFLAAGTGLTPATAGSRICYDHEKVVDHLGDAYGETPTALGLAGNGNVIELFVSAAGTFTIVMTPPGGPSCFVAAGDNWEDLPLTAMVKGDGA